MTLTFLRPGRTLVVLVALLALSWARPAQAGLLSSAQEQEIGAQAAARLEARYPLVKDPALLARVRNLGQLLAARSGRTDIPYTFKVVDVADLNAMALPGGYIYATRGLVEAMNDDELAFVLAHEIAHVARRHPVKALEQQLYAQGIVTLIAIWKGGLSEGTQNTLGLVHTVLSNRLSQADEMEADQVGQEMMAAAGIDPHGAVAALERMKARSRGDLPLFNELFSDHPSLQRRIEAARKRAAQIPFTPAAAPTSPPPPQPPPQASLPLADTAAEAYLRAQLQGAGLALQPRAELMESARAAQGQPPASRMTATEAVVTLTFPATMSLAQVKSRLVNRSLIPILRRQPHFRYYGLSVARVEQGQRRLIMLLR